MKLSNKIVLNVKELVAQYTVKVEFLGMQEFKIRFWIAKQLIRFAIWLCWAKPVIVEEK